jgi:hypothetical protein
VYERLTDAERAEGLDAIYRYANSIARYDEYGDKVNASKANIINWGKQSLTRLNEAA